MRQIEPATGKNNQYAQVKMPGDDPLQSRAQAATDAGLSPRQRKTALRVASVPDDEFNAAVESDEPHTVTQLAEQGKKSKPKPSLTVWSRYPYRDTHVYYS